VKRHRLGSRVSLHWEEERFRRSIHMVSLQRNPKTFSHLLPSMARTAEMLGAVSRSKTLSKN